jgi:glutamine cyclotransferase
MFIRGKIASWGMVSGILLLAAVGSLSSCGNREAKPGGAVPVAVGASTAQSSSSVPIDTYQVVASWPHDRSAFTQGLEFYQGVLYEGTGLNGQSSLRKVDLETGKVLQQRDLASEYFGEGITVFHGKIYQLTWRSHKGFVYDVNTFRPLGEFSFTGEGWGLSHDDGFLIMSDGTNLIRFLDPVSFETKRTISVFSEGAPLTGLNELEYIRGEIYANVWTRNYIVRIDPANGGILGWIDLNGLLSAADQEQSVDVLNGIAYDERNDRLVVTGKLWPKIFQIKLVRK